MKQYVDRDSDNCLARSYRTDDVFYTDNYGKNRPNVPKETTKGNCQKERQINQSWLLSWTAPLPGKPPLAFPKPFSHLALAPREGGNLNIVSSKNSSQTPHVRSRHLPCTPMTLSFFTTQSTPIIPPELKVCFPSKLQEDALFNAYVQGWQ